VEEVLRNYTGNRQATFESGRGWDFLTIQDDISDYNKEISDELTLYVVEQYLEKKSIPFSRYDDIDIFYYVEPFRAAKIFDIEDMFDTDLKIKDLLQQKEDLPENELWNAITKK
jgi:hypothetical protein